jgi:hypothetical protein
VGFGLLWLQSEKRGKMKFKRNKYGNKEAAPCKLNHAHRSKLEGSVCAMLQLDKQSKIIQTEQHVHLTNARILYIPDFTLQNVITGSISYAEAKGFETPEWRIKRRLWKHYGPAPLQIWRGTYQKPFLDEIITPEVEQKEKPPGACF